MTPIIGIYQPEMALRHFDSFPRCSVEQTMANAMIQQQQQNITTRTNSSSNNSNNNNNKPLDGAPELGSISPSSSSSSLISSCKKSVRFNDSNSIQTVHETLSHKDYTPAEKAATWWAAHDMALIKQELIRLLGLMEHKIFKGDNLDVSCRGLEVRQVKLIRNCREAVMKEQQKHQMTPGTDAAVRSIASRYALYNRKAAIVARQRGKADYKELTYMYSPRQLEKERVEGLGYYR